MNRGFEGGIETAHDFRCHVLECLRWQCVDMARDLGIVIYVYADVQELAKRYLEPGLPQTSELPKAQDKVREFYQGFNSGHPCSIIDDLSVSPIKKYELRGK